ncbi:adenine phosphoribosyltransferase [Nanoarchaeota archaeon]
MEHLKKTIRTVPNWPKEGVMFRDITTLMKDPKAFSEVLEIFYNRYKDKDIGIVAGIESRGFILAGAIAHKLGVGFIPIRKPGKLPAETESVEYELEYGKDKIEIHKDAIQPGLKVLLMDDLIATGGTATAACELIKRLNGNIVEIACIIDLPDLKGSQKLKESHPVFSIMQFEGD